MRDEELFDKMDDYLLGKLDTEAARSFEAELAQHPDWQEELFLRRLEHEGMETLLEDRLRADMQHWKGEKKRPRRRRWLWLAALPLCGATLFFWWKQTPVDRPYPASQVPADSLSTMVQPIDSQILEKEKDLPGRMKNTTPRQLPTAVATPLVFAEKAVGDLDLRPGVRGDDAPALAAFADSLDLALEKKDYAWLLRLTDTAVPGSRDAEQRYVRGWALFKLRRFVEAETIFKELADSKLPRLQVKAERMLLYTYLAQQPKRQQLLGNLVREILEKKSHPLSVEAQAMSRFL